NNSQGIKPWWYKTLEERTLTNNTFRNIKRIFHLIHNIPTGLHSKLISLHLNGSFNRKAQWQHITLFLHHHNPTNFYTDGSIVNANTKSIKASAAWTTWPPDKLFSHSIEGTISTTKAETFALCTLTEAITNNQIINVYTDSQALIQGYNNNITNRSQLSIRKTLKNSHWPLWE
ncbi:13145_t:CDS:1, partial [Ambispora gerdemannii]